MFAFLIPDLISVWPKYLHSFSTSPKVKAKAMAKAVAAPKQPQARNSQIKARRLYADVAALAGVTADQARCVLDATHHIASRELRVKAVFVIPNLVKLRLWHKQATDAKVKVMFGKEVHIAARPARTQVKASVLKHMQDATQ